MESWYAFHRGDPCVIHNTKRTDRLRLLSPRTTANLTGILNDAGGPWFLFRGRVGEDYRQGLARLVGTSTGSDDCPRRANTAGDRHGSECTGPHLPEDIPSEPGTRVNSSTGSQVLSGAKYGAVANRADAVGPQEYVQWIKSIAYNSVSKRPCTRFIETTPRFSFLHSWRDCPNNLRKTIFNLGSQHQRHRTVFRKLPLALEPSDLATQATLTGSLSLTVRAPIVHGPHLLYTQTTANRPGTLYGPKDFWSLFRTRVKA